MESNNRTVWIILAVIVVVVCCCALTFAGAAGAWFTFQPVDWRGVTSIESERSEEAFPVSGTPNLQIDSFAGNVVLRAGPSGVIRIAATKRAPSRSDLDRIEVKVSERDGGLVVRTEKPRNVNNASVLLEITAPAGTSLDAVTGAGNVETDGIIGEIDAHTGAGEMDVRGAAVCARLDTGAGGIRYQGTPQGECRFETGAGNITLVLPADLNAQVELETGVGQIDADFDVDGQVSRRSVQGVVGSGTEATIYAHSGAGNIDVVRR